MCVTWYNIFLLGQADFGHGIQAKGKEIVREQGLCDFTYSFFFCEKYMYTCNILTCNWRLNFTGTTCTYACIY